MIGAEEIMYQIQKKDILKSCSLSVGPGSFTAVVGPNGAGKSTFLKILCGEIINYQGIVKVNGKDLKKIKQLELSRLRAVLPQHTIVNFPFTVEQIIEMGRYPHLTTRMENERIGDEVIERLHLEPFRKRVYQNLSGGEQQRVQMARVMSQIWDKDIVPKYLLLDEPTSNLDLAQQQALLKMAKEMCGRNVGVLAILHDLNLAIQYADQILFLKEGCTVAKGSLSEVINRETIESTFSHPVQIIEDDRVGHPIIFPVTEHADITLPILEQSII